MGLVFSAVFIFLFALARLIYWQWRLVQSKSEGRLLDRAQEVHDLAIAETLYDNARLQEAVDVLDRGRQVEELMVKYGLTRGEARCTWDTLSKRRRDMLLPLEQQYLADAKEPPHGL